MLCSIFLFSSCFFPHFYSLTWIYFAEHFFFLNHIWKLARKAIEFFWSGYSLTKMVHFSNVSLLRKQMVWSEAPFIVYRLMFSASCQDLICNFKIAVFSAWALDTIKILIQLHEEKANFYMRSNARKIKNVSRTHFFQLK